MTLSGSFYHGCHQLARAQSSYTASTKPFADSESVIETEVHKYARGGDLEGFNRVKDLVNDPDAALSPAAPHTVQSTTITPASTNSNNHYNMVNGAGRPAATFGLAPPLPQPYHTGKICSSTSRGRCSSIQGPLPSSRIVLSTPLWSPLRLCLIAKVREARWSP